MAVPDNIVAHAQYLNSLTHNTAPFRPWFNEQVNPDFSSDALPALSSQPTVQAQVEAAEVNDPQLPSTMQMVWGLTTQVKNMMLLATTKGQFMATPEETQRRMSICNDCEFFLPEQNSRCSKCGCFMNFKTRLAASPCPINKW